MSHNKIQKFEMTDLQSFTQTNITVDLRYNEINEINFRELIDENGMESAKVLLDFNPIRCDCKLLHFVKFLRDPKLSISSKVKIHHDNLMCTSPERMERRMVSTLEPLELKCLLDDISSKKKLCPLDCSSCEVRSEDKTLILNCYGNVSMESLPIAKNVKQDNLELILESQNLTVMPWSSSLSYRQIGKLFLSGNKIHQVTELPPNLVEIDLRNNRLEMMNETIFKSLNDSKTLEYMSLVGNPWRCECDQFNFINFVRENRNKIRDYNELKCADGRFFKDLIKDDLCSQDNVMIIIASIILAVTSIVIGTFMALYYKYQKQIKMWLYSHNLCLWFVTEEELDKDKTYDAFVSYAHQDSDFIADHLVPQLENCAVPYKLCLHERDWLPGLEISCEYFFETFKN
jgi:protein toll